MKRFRLQFVWALAAVCFVAAGCAAHKGPPPARGEHGMVSTIHPIATDAAVHVMRNGGNAIDAAVEAALMLGVVDGHNSGIGGGCFMLVRLADGRVFAIDGREMAPAKATRDMFIHNGKGDTTLSQTGALASGIPGSLAVYQYATEHFGKKKLGDLLEPAAQVAEQGFAINAAYAKKLKTTAGDIAKFDGSRAILLHDGKPYAEGDILKQTDLAKTYRAIAREGTDYFYKGPFAQAVGDWMAKNGGVITAEDFAAYRIQLREPLRTTYRGYTVVGFPPPSSGGVHVAEMLNILETFDLKDMPPADRVHVIAESMKLAFADRAYWLGDPDYVKVPRGLVDKEYGRQLAQKISIDKAGKFDHGIPPAAAEDVFGRKHTTHIATADAEGNVVALTATVNTSFGSKVIVPGTGVLLNNQMDDFSIQPGVANHFGLVGADANAVAPGKRPLSSMSPTIILKRDKLVLTVGAAGGPKIITQVLLAVTNVLDLGDDAHTALARPRYHHQWSPDELWIENTFDKQLMDELRRRGHKLNVVEPAGASQLIVVDPKDGSFQGQTETRASGKAAGF